MFNPNERANDGYLHAAKRLEAERIMLQESEDEQKSGSDLKGRP